MTIEEIRSVIFVAHRIYRGTKTLRMTKNLLLKEERKLKTTENSVEAITDE